MRISDLDRKEYQDISIYTMKDNPNDGIQVYLRRVSGSSNPPLSPLHRHMMVQINYVTRGKLLHEINHQQFDLVKGDIFIIPPYIPHQLIPVGNLDFEIIELEFVPEFIFGNVPGSYANMDINSSLFDFSYIEPFLVTEKNVKPRLNLSGKEQLLIEELLDEIFSEYTDKKDSFLLAIKADLLKLLVLVGRCFQANIKDDNTAQLFTHHRDAMMSAISYTDAHFADPITIEYVSRVAMLSQSYFSYLFKMITNKTFVEYLTSLRLEHAMDMLKNTDRQVVDICYESGFKSVNHFNRAFKNKVGISPTQYRKSNFNRNKSSAAKT